MTPWMLASHVFHWAAVAMLAIIMLLLSPIIILFVPMVGMGWFIGTLSADAIMGHRRHR